MITQIFELAQDADGRWVFDEIQLQALVTMHRRHKNHMTVSVTRTSGGVPRIRVEVTKEGPLGQGIRH